MNILGIMVGANSTAVLMTEGALRAAVSEERFVRVKNSSLFPENAFRPDRVVTDHDKHYFSGLPPEFWLEHGLSDADLKSFMAPKYEEITKNKTKIHFFGYYGLWDPQENFYYSLENCGFRPNPERNEGTFSKYASIDDKFDGFHFYLAFINIGFTQSTVFAN